MERVMSAAWRVGGGFAWGAVALGGEVVALILLFVWWNDEAGNILEAEAGKAAVASQPQGQAGRVDSPFVRRGRSVLALLRIRPRDSAAGYRQLRQTFPLNRLFCDQAAGLVFIRAAGSSKKS